MSSSDLPACPACGSRRVHAVQDPPKRTFYGCAQCGRDQTDAWEAVQPERRPAPEPIVGPPTNKPAVRSVGSLGIAATVKL